MPHTPSNPRLSRRRMLGTVALLGAGASGYQMSQQTMVLEFGERADVAMRLALSTSLAGSTRCGVAFGCA